MTLSSGSVDLTSPSHIGFIVEDINKTSEFLSSNWNVGPWYHTEYSLKKEQMIVGEPFRIKTAHAKLLGALLIELIQPLERATVWSDFLKTHGEGIHHIAYEVMNWDDIVSKLQTEGAKMLVGAMVDGIHFCYLITKPGGIIVELADIGINTAQEEFLGL